MSVSLCGGRSGLDRQERARWVGSRMYRHVDRFACFPTESVRLRVNSVIQVCAHQTQISYISQAPSRQKMWDPKVRSRRTSTNETRSFAWDLRIALGWNCQRKPCPSSLRLCTFVVSALCAVRATPSMAVIVILVRLEKGNSAKSHHTHIIIIIIIIFFLRNVSEPRHGYLGREPRKPNYLPSLGL